MTPLPIYVERFFTERLSNQLSASPNTIDSYRLWRDNVGETARQSG